MAYTHEKYNSDGWKIMTWDFGMGFKNDSLLLFFFFTMLKVISKLGRSIFARGTIFLLHKFSIECNIKLKLKNMRGDEKSLLGSQYLEARD